MAQICDNRLKFFLGSYVITSGRAPYLAVFKDGFRNYEKLKCWYLSQKALGPRKKLESV